MLKHVTFLGTAVLAMTLATGAIAQDVTTETVVAKVGETEITLGEVLVVRTGLPAQYAQFPNAVLFAGIIDQLVQQQLLADELAKVPGSITYNLLNEARALKAGEVITAIAESSVTEEAIAAAYEERFADVEEVKEFSASHLLVETQEAATAAKARIDEGAAFADVARDVSTGPTGPNGGDLGWFSSGAMVPEFEDAITSLEIGGVSEPFETQFGWHVATLKDTRVQPQPSLDDMRRELTAELQELAVSARLEELAAAQTIVKPAEGDFDPDLLDNVDWLE